MDKPTPRTDAAWEAMFNGDCLPKCDSYGHEDMCPRCNGDRVMAEFARELERSLAAAEREISRITELHKGLMAEADRRVEEAEKDLDETRAVIAQHDLCHNSHGKVDAVAFAEGCEAEQRKLYGCAPHTDQLSRAKEVLRQLHAMVKGECPSLLNEDSGGSGHLDIAISKVLPDEKA